MTDNIDNVALVKAASAGFVQALINRGCPEDLAAAAAVAYADPNEGLLAKRASAKQQVLETVIQAVGVLRGAI